MPFNIIRNDITKIKADAIVNTAGGGTDTAVYNAAGADELLAERKKIGNIAVGDAVATPAFALDAKYIIHTVGPYWQGGEHGERELLRSCYRKSLELADKLDCKSIAFPLISTGVYKFPKGEALHIALSVIQEFLLTHDMEVTIAVFDKGSFELSGKLFAGIDEYIDEHYVEESVNSEYYTNDIRRIRAIERERMIVQRRAETSLDDVMKNRGETFSEMLFRLIDASGMDDVEVYKKANIDRKVFSSIKCKSNYKPKKKTAVAFAIALQLDMPTMLDLLSRAEIAFSPSNKFDLIIKYYVEAGIYDIYEINEALFRFGQPILGE